jgi:hypothetical protein
MKHHGTALVAMASAGRSRAAGPGYDRTRVRGPRDAGGDVMTVILCAGGIVLSAAVVGIRLLARQAPDLAWRPTGVRFTTGRDYLQAQGIANALEARRHTARGRPYQRDVELPAARVDAVAVTPRRRAEVVQLHRRQA